jgi:hypothetical protein
MTVGRVCGDCERGGCDGKYCVGGGTRGTTVGGGLKSGGGTKTGVGMGICTGGVPWSGGTVGASYDLFVPAVRLFPNRTGTISWDNGPGTSTSVFF